MTENELKAKIESTLKNFSADDQKAICHIATQAMENNKAARDTLRKLFPDIPMNLAALYQILNKAYDSMTPIEQESDYHYSQIALERNIARGKPCSAPSVASLRLGLGMTQKELAAKVGVNVRWIQKLEYGETLVENVTGIKLLKLAEALEVDPHDLVKW